MKLMSKAHFTGNVVEHSNIIFCNFQSIDGDKMVKNEIVTTISTYQVNSIVN